MSINFEVISISPRFNKKNDYSVLIYKINFPKTSTIDRLNDYVVFFNTLIDAGVKKIIINMKNVEYVDSSSIGLLINITKIFRKAGGDLLITNVTSDIKGTFDVIKLKEFIVIMNKDIEAIEKFRYI